LPKVFSLIKHPKSPLTPFAKGGNYKESPEKSPFEKGEFKNWQLAENFGKRYNWR
jgi:hypothetical protein